MGVAKIEKKSVAVQSGLAFDQASILKAKRRLLRDASNPNGDRDRAFRIMILSIPVGKVSTYGGVAAAAGYPLYHRAVARLLRTETPDQLPWHRVVGARGEIKLPGDAAREQRARLKMEGVEFRGRRVDMDRFECRLRPWDVWQ
jgi:methylated-DNA-protein-cysteine methyltransferase-like protein